MGRATIAGGGPEGLFSIALDYGKAARDAAVARIDARVAALNAEIAAKGDAVAVAAAETLTASTALNTAIDALVLAQQAVPPAANIPALTADVDARTRDFARASAREAALRVPRDLLIAERAALTRRRGELTAALIEETRQAWCVDLTESASGAVATIEVPGEDAAILIAPGCRAPTGADGALRARELLSPEQVFFNAAILPGWQKFKPTYRKGTLLGVDRAHNLATVQLDPANSSAQGLGVNQQTTLTGIPVTYMTCHAEAFEVGDRVIVQFDGQLWSASRVIGFVDHPKSCAKFTVRYEFRGQSVGAAAASLYFPAPAIVGSTLQLVSAGRDATPVTAGPSQTQYKWVSWSDGLVSQGRHDTNITADLTVYADYLVAEAAFGCEVLGGFTPDGAPYVYMVQPAIPGYTWTDWPDVRVFPLGHAVVDADRIFNDPVTAVAGGHTITYAWTNYVPGYSVNEFEIFSW